MIWCAEHNQPPDPESPSSCWLWTEGGLGSTLQIRGEPQPCRMVEALLIVKENGEWPEAALNAVADALGTLEQARWALDALGPLQRTKRND